MLNLNWNTIFNRIELATGSKGAGKALILFEGTSAKRVRIEKVVNGNDLTLVSELGTCQDNNGRNTPCTIPLERDTSYVITPLSGASCTAQADTPFTEPDLIRLLEPDENMHAAVYAYHCHLTDRDNVHITIVIEDVSGSDPILAAPTHAQSITATPGHMPVHSNNETSTNGTVISG